MKICGRGGRVDRSRVERDTSKPVRHQEQVISLRNPTVDVSDSTGEDRQQFSNSVYSDCCVNILGH